jgi:hypothetical protein
MRRRRPSSSVSALDVALNDLVGRLVGDVAAMARTTAMAALASAVGGEREIHRRVAAKLESRLRRDAKLTGVRMAKRSAPVAPRVFVRDGLVGLGAW